MSKILLIDDDVFFQKFYATKLKENNLEVDTASDGDEGLVNLKNNKYDLVLLDLVMPRVDGFEVLKQISANPKINKAPVIVFSTLGAENDLKEAKNLGAVDYISKTFGSFDELLGKIKKLIT